MILIATKNEILENLPNPREVELPNYFLKTISEEIGRSGLSTIEIEAGKRKLNIVYNLLKRGISNAPPYSDKEVYLGYIDTYLRLYYPRMSLF